MQQILAISFLIFACSYVYPQSRSPNVVVIITDDHTMQAIGAYGASYGVSPHVDRLAREGAVFNRAFVTNSICAPSRAVMLTGKYSHKNGHINNLTKFDASQDVFPRRLQHAGYQTAWIGKWHLEATPQGFDYWQVLPGQGSYYNPLFLTMDGGRKKIEGYCTDIITDITTQWLDRRDRSKPFCLVVGHKSTHRTWMPDTADLGALDHLEFPLPDNFYDDYKGRLAAAHQDLSIEKTMQLGYDLKMFDDTTDISGVYRWMNAAQRQRFFSYYDSIRHDFEQQRLSGRALTEWKYQRYMKDYLTTAISLDRNVGRLMSYLEENDLMENTMVVYTSDQGFYLGEHGWFDKRFMYEESMRTPLIIRYPALIKGGTIINDLVVNLDFAPTFLQLAGHDVPPDVQGKSMLPLFRGEKKGDAWRAGVYYHYYEYPGEHNVYRHFGIRTSRYKLICFYGEQNFWELYDLQNDPQEMKNLYPEEGYRTIAGNLKEQLVQLIKEYDDKEALNLIRGKKN